jgi:hypothetical protein
MLALVERHCGAGRGDGVNFAMPVANASPRPPNPGIRKFSYIVRSGRLGSLRRFSGPHDRTESAPGKHGWSSLVTNHESSGAALESCMHLFLPT